MLCSYSTLKSAIDFLTRLGSVIYFPVHDLLVLDPLWLSSIFASVAKISTIASNNNDAVYGYPSFQLLWKASF
jgi:hypothetical protein